MSNSDNPFSSPCPPRNVNLASLQYPPYMSQGHYPFYSPPGGYDPNSPHAHHSQTSSWGRPLYPGHATYGTPPLTPYLQRIPWPPSAMSHRSRAGNTLEAMSQHPANDQPAPPALDPSLDSDPAPGLVLPAAARAKTPPASTSLDTSSDPAPGSVLPPAAGAKTPTSQQGDESSNDSEASNTLTPARKQRKKKRLRPNKGNLIHGNVANVGCGSKAIVIPRPVALRGYETSTTRRTARYKRLIEDLIARCERVSDETECWLYLSTQHSNSTKSFLHYTSPRLRREGGEHLDAFHNAASRMMKALLETRRKEAVDLHINLEKTKAAMKEKEQQIEEQAARIAALEAQLEN